MTDADERANDKDKDEDRLRALHNDPQVLADVRGEDSATTTRTTTTISSRTTATTWLPLESNPEIFTKFARRIAQLPSEWEFVDVLGIDESLLQLVPRPVAAVIMLFPCTDKIYDYRSHQKKELLLKLQQNQNKEQHQQRRQFCQENPASKKVIHIEQVASFGNACGTIACLHVMSNLSALSSSSSSSSLSSNNALNEIFQRHNISIPDIGDNGSAVSNVQKTMSSMDNARDRGKLLVQSTEFHESSDEAATSTSAQTECPATGDTHLGHHYVAFVPIPVENNKVHIVELDGTKISPIDHGPVESIHHDAVGNSNDGRNEQDDGEQKQQERTGQEGPTTKKKKKDQHNQSSDFLHAVMTVCRTKWMDLEPGRIDFSLMALSKTTTTTTK